MRKFSWFVAAFLIGRGVVAAQGTGEVTTVDLVGGKATVTLDFSARDYELILLPLVTTEEDTARTFSYTVSGSAVTSKPAIRSMNLQTDSVGAGRIKDLLRERERILAERLSARGGWHPAAKKIVEPAQIGSARSFSYSGFLSTSEDQTVQATLVATSSRAVAYLDNAASDTVKINTTDIQEMLDRFSTVSYPVVTGTFGEGSDVDGDGKVLFLFTQLVDREEVIAGYYSASSLFTVAEGGDGNVADMMYIGLESGRDFYDPMLAHEFQHLVNYNQHVLIKGGTREESWLNEALAHYSEDLVDGHVTGQMARIYGPFLEGPENYSLTGSAGTSSGNRGTSYLFLRGLVREFGDGIVTQLVQTPLAGTENVEQATGKPFEELLVSHASRLFLSGTGLNTESKYNFSFSFFTEPTTGQRSIPMPFEIGFSANGTPVTGRVKPLAPAYLRMMGEGSSVSVDIATESTGNFKVILIPIPQDFRPQRSLKGNYFPGITFDAPIAGQYTSGEAIRISGSLTNQNGDRILYRFQSTGAAPDTIRFFSDAVNGQFGRSIVLHPTQAGEYELEIFAGEREESLDFVGRFVPVHITAGPKDVLLPVDFFSGITLDSPLAVDFTAGEAFRVSGSSSDQTITELLLNWTPAGNLDGVLRFAVDVIESRFDRTLVFHPSQAGNYEFELFAGAKGESKPIVDGFAPITVSDTGGSFTLPATFFPGITFNSGIPEKLPSGEGVKFTGTVSNPNSTRILLRFDPLSHVGDSIRVSIDPENGAFDHTEFFSAAHEGEYKLTVFAGNKGESLPFVDSFLPFSIVEGSGELSLPTDYFPGLTLDDTFPGNVKSGQAIALAGNAADASVTQLLFRFDPVAGSGEPIRFFSTVTGGRFQRSIIFTAEQAGEYTLNVFGGPQGGSLAFFRDFSPFTVTAVPDPVKLPVDYFESVLLDAPLPAEYFPDQSVQVSGTMSDLTITQILVRFDPLIEGTDQVRFVTNVTDGKFDQTIIFTPEQTGDYTLNLFGGQTGEGLPFLDSFTPIRVSSGPRMVVRQKALAFGNVSIGKSGTASMVIVNQGNESLSVTQVTSDNARFGITLDPFSLAGGDSLVATVVFTPESVGKATGNLTLTSNDPAASTLQIGLTGSGSESTQVLEPALTLRTSLLDFGTIKTGETTTKTFGIVNTGTDTLRVDNVSGASAPFQTVLVTVIPVFVIAPGDSAAVLVSFVPAAAGNFTGVLTLSGNVPDVMLALAGSAISATSDTGKVGDFNGDGNVAFSDFIQFAGAYGTKPGSARYDAKFDLDGNGDIGFQDFIIFARNYGK
jgi:hypothetical protein